MTRHFAREASTFTIVALFVTIVTSLATVTAVAQVRDRAQTSAEVSIGSSSREAILLRSNSQGLGAVPADSGNSIFLPASGYSFPSVPYPFSAAVADLNGDGKPDIAVGSICGNAACSGDGVVSILLGNGDGTFTAGATYDPGGRPISVVIADVNHDGKPDIVVNNEEYVGVLLGNGDGTFQPAVTYGLGGNSPEAIALADVNGDGHPDIVVALCDPSGCFSASGLVGVLLGNGDGTFQPEVSYDAGGTGAFSVAVADLNGDGHPDIVVDTCQPSSCFDTSGLVGVLLGNGDGTFKSAVTYSGGYGIGLVTLADVNGDAKPDLLVTSCLTSSCTEGAVGVMLGKGDGTFKPGQTLYDSGGYDPTSLNFVDVNGDGVPDLVVGNCGTETGCGSAASAVGVLLGNGDGSFQPVVTYGSGGAGLQSLVVADVNADGRPDIVAFNTNGSPANSTIGVLINVSSEYGKLTTTRLRATPNPSIFGEAITLIATATAKSGPPPGSILFYDGSTPIGGATLVKGKASVAISALATGSHALTAVYLGSEKLGPSTSAVVNQVVNPASSTTVVVSSVNPSSFDQSVMFTATVSSAAGTPTGTVNFYDGSTAIGSAELANGSAAISVLLAVGSHSITADYLQSADFAPSTSAAVKQVVNSESTTTALASSALPGHINQTITYTATVTSQFGGTPTGTVTFLDGTTSIATVAISGNKAAHTTSYPALGTHSITATYSGDSNDMGSTSAILTEKIFKDPPEPYPSVATVTTSGSPSFVGQPVTFTATVTSSYGAIPDGEVVTFYDDPHYTVKTEIASGTTVGGVVTLTTSSLVQKGHIITATYAGDAKFKPASGTVLQTVDQYPTTTTLVPSQNPTYLNEAVTFYITVTSAGGPTPTGQVNVPGLGLVTLSGGAGSIDWPAHGACGKYGFQALYLGDEFSATSRSESVKEFVICGK